jgi:hypothetical protein
MTWVFAVLAGVAGALAGWLVVGALAVWLAGLAGMSDFEGGRGMFAFLGVGPLGGLAGMVAGAWAVLRHRRGATSLGRTVARLAAVIGGIALLSAAGIWLWLASGDTYTDSLPPTLEFELRVPDGVDTAAVEVELHTDRNLGERVRPEPRVREGAATLLAGRVALAFKTTSRLLVVSIAGQPRRLFALRLRRDPAASAEPSPWQGPQFLDDPGESPPRPAPADDPVALRYRVRRAGDE